MFLFELIFSIGTVGELYADQNFQYEFRAGRDSYALIDAKSKHCTQISSTTATSATDPQQTWVNPMCVKFHFAFFFSFHLSFITSIECTVWYSAIDWWFSSHSLFIANGLNFSPIINLFLNFTVKTVSSSTVPVNSSDHHQQLISIEGSTAPSNGSEPDSLQYLKPANEDAVVWSEGASDLLF